MSLSFFAILAAVAGIYILIVPPSLECLDTKPIYSPAFVLTFLQSLGPDVREEYFRHEIADILFLIGYSGIFLLFLSAALSKKISELPWRTLLLALSMGFFDLIETSGILLALHLFPDVPVWLTWTIAIATPLKYLSSFVLFYYCWRVHRLARAR